MLQPRRPSERGRLDAGPLLFVLGLVVGLLGALVAERVTSRLVDRDIELVRAVRNLAIEEYVDEVAPDALIDDALDGMLSGLDPYSRFYGREHVAQVDRDTYGEFRGVGVVFRRPVREGQVLFPFPNSPAERADLRVGDRILEIDGQRVAEMETGELQRTIQRSEEDELSLLVVGLDGAERNLVLGLEQVVDPTVRHARLLDPDRGIGYLAILSFSHRTPDEFDRAVADLQEQGMERLVIDVRMNPGGILNAAVQIANRFIEKGPLVATRTRQETQVTEAKPELARLRDLPLVLLVDSGSASASEVLAGALQDHAVAAIVGTSSYGKGTVQTMRHLGDDRGIVKLTTATYYTPSWRRIERQGDEDSLAGIAPDVQVPLDDEERLRVYEYLATYSPPTEYVGEIERWEADEGVELITDHPADRQLDTAVAVLAGRTDELHVHGAQ